MDTKQEQRDGRAVGGQVEFAPLDLREGNACLLIIDQHPGNGQRAVQQDPPMVRHVQSSLEYQGAHNIHLYENSQNGHRRLLPPIDGSKPTLRSCKGHRVLKHGTPLLFI